MQSAEGDLEIGQRVGSGCSGDPNLKHVVRVVVQGPHLLATPGGHKRAPRSCPGWTRSTGSLLGPATAAILTMAILLALFS